jgi:hypothetical protein
MWMKDSTNLCEMTLWDQVVLQVPVSCHDGDSLTSINNFSVAVEGGALSHSNLFFCAVQLKLHRSPCCEGERGPTPPRRYASWTQLVQCTCYVVDAVQMDSILPDTPSASYLHWKWDDSQDSSSIITVLLLHFISGTSGAKILPQIISGITLRCKNNIIIAFS